MHIENPARVLATLVTLVLGAFLATAPPARAGLSAEQKCQKGRYDADAQYAKCHANALGQLFANNDLVKLQPVLSKCRVKYTGTWLKLQKKALGTGSTCDAPRFIDNGDGTVTDHLTALDWEKKTASDVHYADNHYSWVNAYALFLSSPNPPLRGLNELQPPDFSACFTPPCNWRLPTVAELQTVLSEPFPCTTSPCIDAVFGTTPVDDYWTSTTLADNPDYAWGVYSGTGEVSYGLKTLGNLVRGVRGGL